MQAVKKKDLPGMLSRTSPLSEGLPCPLEVPLIGMVIKDVGDWSSCFTVTINAGASVATCRSADKDACKTRMSEIK